MRKIKTPVQSYENFCKAFAGVFLKYAKDKGTFHTCYIRGLLMITATPTLTAGTY